MPAIVLATLCMLAAAPAAPGDSLAPTVPRDSLASAAPGDSLEPAAPHDSLAAHAEAVVDTTVRVTGSRLRFGYTPEMASRHGDFPIAKVAGRPREVARRGRARWFGLDAEATLFFKSGRLARAQFEVKEVGPRDVLHVQDELRRAGFRRECDAPVRGQPVCNWIGPTLIKLTLGTGSHVATIEPRPRPAPPPAPAAPVFVPARDVFVLGRPGVKNAFPDPQFETPPDTRALYPRAAREAGVQGNVWFRASVDTAGAIVASSIVKGNPLLDAAATEAVKQVRFRPYRVAGAPTRFEVEFPVRFLLH